MLEDEHREWLRTVATGSLLSTPSMLKQHIGYVEVERFSPYLGETLVVMRKDVEDGE